MPLTRTPPSTAKFAAASGSLRRNAAGLTRQRMHEVDVQHALVGGIDLQEIDAVQERLVRVVPAPRARACAGATCHRRSVRPAS